MKNFTLVVWALLNLFCSTYSFGISTKTVHPTSENVQNSSYLLENTCAGNLGENLIEGGDFGSGTVPVLATNPGLITDFDYIANLAPGDGGICVANTTANANTNPQDYWVAITNNSPDPNGYMLVVDSWYSAKKVYETTVSGLCENTLYQFSIDAINLVNPIHTWATDAYIDFFIDNEQVFTTESIMNDYTWHTYTFYYTVPEGQTEVTFHIENAVPGGNFGDFALDNIQMQQCYPFTELGITGPTSLCEGDDLILEADLALHGYIVPYFQWSKLNSTTNEWVELASEQTANLSIINSSMNHSGTYRCVVANSPNNTDNAACWGDEAYFTVSIDEKPTDAFVELTICENETYFFGGIELLSGGEYRDTVTTALGCDSITILNLAIAPLPNSSIEMTICEGESYAFGNTNYTESGTYQSVNPSQYGCDSTATLILTVLPSYNNTISTQICAGESYPIGNNTYSESGTYTETLVAVNGCDSIINLQLMVVDVIETMLTASICEGESYSMGGNTYNTTGDFTMQLLSQTGCDSIVYLELDVLQNFETHLTSTICSGEVFSIENTDYTTTGSFTNQLVASNGCDSLVTLDLTVLQAATLVLNENLCFGESYTFENQTYTTSGSYTEMLQTSAGCDSTVVLNLTIQEAASNMMTATICAGESYPLGTDTYNTPGQYSYVFQTQSGCDSTVYLDLAVAETYETYLDAAICNGESYQVGDNNFVTSGTFQTVFQAQNGCDSTVYLNLDVFTSYESAIADIICEGESVEIGNENFSTSGFHTATLQTTTGCDSIVNLTLSVIPSSIEELDFEMCSGDLFNGIEINNDTSFVEFLQTQFGCDSTVQTNIIALPTSVSDQEVELCYGESFQGSVYEGDTILVDLLTNYWGCDSTVYTSVIVHPAPETTDTIIVDITDEGRFTEENPKGEKVDLDTANRSPSDTLVLTETFTTIHGCDSTVNTMYIYLYPVETHLNVTLCEGNEYLDIPYFENTTLTENLETIHGTDSTIYTHINVLPSALDTVFANICAGESFLAGGAQQTTSGFYTDNYLTENGCDSIIITQLLVYENTSTQSSLQICTGENILINGESQATAGVYTNTYSDRNGCDSTSTIELIVLPLFDTDLSVEICAGELYEGLAIANDTIITETYNTIYNCDSIINTYISVIPHTDTTLYVTLPAGGSYNDVVYNDSATTTDIISNYAGCDSTILTIITVIDATETFLEYTLCEGASQDGVTYFQDTVFTQNLLTVAGFDSLVTTTIHINFPQTTFLEDSSCEFPDGTTQEIVYADQNGCDSTVITTFMFMEADVVELDVTLCSGETYQGIVYTEDTVVILENTNQNGCDSTTTLLIEVLPIPQINLDGIEQFCATESITIDLGDLETTIWTEASVQLEGMTISEGGYYYIQATNAFGCSVIDTIWVPNPTEIQAEMSFNPPPCYDQSGATITIDTVYGGEAPYLYSMNGSALQLNPSFDGLTSGVFEINIQDVNGCEFNDVIVIEDVYTELEVDLGDDAVIEWGNEYTFNPIVNNPNLVDQVIWTTTGNDALSCDDCLNPSVTPNDIATYVVTVITSDGCETSDEIILRVEKERNVYIPNAFTPDGDGTNDVFSIYAGQGVERVNLMQIYDRWGNQLFERTDFDSADEDLGWKGDFRGKMMNSGVYVYYVEILFEDGVVKEYKGDVTLL